MSSFEQKIVKHTKKQANTADLQEKYKNLETIIL